MHIFQNENSGKAWDQSVWILSLFVDCFLDVWHYVAFVVSSMHKIIFLLLFACCICGMFWYGSTHAIMRTGEMHDTKIYASILFLLIVSSCMWLFDYLSPLMLRNEIMEISLYYPCKCLEALVLCRGNIKVY